MLVVKHKHLKCLQRLLSAAVLPPVADETPTGRGFHGSTAALTSDASSQHAAGKRKQQQQQQQQSLASQEQPQMQAAAAAAVDLAAAVAAQQQKQHQVQQLPRDHDSVGRDVQRHPHKQKPGQPTAAAKRPLVSREAHGRLGGLKQHLQQGVKHQQVTQQLQLLNNKQQRRTEPATQQEQQQQQQQQQQREDHNVQDRGPAGDPATLTLQGEQQQQQQQQQAWTDRSVLRQQLEALKVAPKPPVPLRRPQPQQQRQSAGPGGGMPTQQQAALQDRQQQQVSVVKQKQKKPRQQHQPQPQARPACTTRTFDAVLPLLVQHMLLHEETLVQRPQQCWDGAAAGDQATASSNASSSSKTTTTTNSCSGADSSSTCSEVPVADAAKPRFTAQYSNWSDVDTSQVLPNLYDTFLGVWPEASCLPPLLEYEPMQELWEEEEEVGELEADVLQLGDAARAAAAAEDTAAADGGAAAVMAAAEAKVNAGQNITAAAALAEEAAAASWADAGSYVSDSSGVAGLCLVSADVFEQPVSGAAAGPEAAVWGSAARFEAAAAATVWEGALEAISAAADAADGSAVLQQQQQQEEEEAQGAPMDPVILQQQQLEAAAATAECGGAQEFTGQAATSSAGHNSSSSSSSSSAHSGLRPGWSVAGMFDAAVGPEYDAADFGTLEGLLEPSSWLSAAAGDQEQQQQHHILGQQAPLAAAAAEAAILASDAAAAAAAAAGVLPRLEVPQHMSLLCAMQWVELQLQQTPQMLLCPPTDSDSSTAPQPDAGAAGNAGADFALSRQQPFAWMFAAPGALPPPASSAVQHAPVKQGYGLQYILQSLHDMLPEGARQFVLQPKQQQPPMWSVVDASLLQYLQPWLQEAQEAQRQMEAWQEAQEAQQHMESWLQQLHTQQQPWKQFSADLLQAAKQYYGFSAPAGADAQHAAAAAGTAGGLPDKLHSTQQPQGQAPVATEIGSDSGVLVPSLQQQYDVSELAVIARVTAMSADTCLEPALWSVLTQQPTQLLPGRHALQHPGRTRQPLWLPGSDSPQQQPSSRNAARKAPGAVSSKAAVQQQSQSQQRATSGWDWFGPVLFAATAAARQAGQLLPVPCLAAVQHTQLAGNPQQPAVEQDGSNNSSSSSSAVQEGVLGLGAQDAEQGRSSTTTTTLSLAAMLPYKAGWNPVLGCWQGLWLQPPARPQLPPGLQQTLQDFEAVQQQLSQHVLSAAAVAAAERSLQERGAACTQVKGAIKSCQDSTALLGVVQEYEHYFTAYPSLPAAVLQQAAQIWAATTTAAPDARSAGGSSSQQGLVMLKALAAGTSSSSTGGEAAAAAAAATATLQLKALANTASGNPSGVVFESLVGWYTQPQPQPQPYTLPLPAHMQAKQLASTGSPGLDAAAKAEGILQLLSLGVEYRGSVLPSNMPLLALLKQLRPQEVLKLVPPQSMAELCEQLLSHRAALQTWPVEEQQGAFALLQAGVQTLQPSALLQLLQLLSQQGHLQQLPEAVQQGPALLYRGVMEQLVRQTQSPHLLRQFAASARQVLQLAQQACLASGWMVLAASDTGHVLPGSDYFERYEQKGSIKQGNEQDYVLWTRKQHAAYIQRLKDWRPRAAATPSIASEVVRAAACGQLQQLAGTLRQVLAAPGSQELLDSKAVADLLWLLACSSPFLRYSDPQEALTVAAVLGGNAPGLAAAAGAVNGLPAAVADWLVASQGDSSAPVQRLSPSAALATVWASLQLKQPQVQGIINRLCTAQYSKDHRASDGGSSSSSNAQGPARSPSGQPLQDWGIQQVRELLEGLHGHSQKGGFKLRQHTFDAIGAAAAQCVQEFVGAVTALASGDSGPASTLLRRRGRKPAGHLLVDAPAVSSISHVMYRCGQYQPALLDALQELIIAADLLRRSKRSRQVILERYSFKRILLTLARFDACSPKAAAAVRQLMPGLLPGSNQSTIAAFAWCLAVLDERDYQLWMALRQAIAAASKAGKAPVAVSSNQESLPRAAAGANPDDRDAAALLGIEAEEDTRPMESALRQLHLAHVYVQRFVPDVAPLLPAHLANEAAHVVKKVEQNVMVSQLQRDVGHILGMLKASESSVLESYQQEQKTGLGSIDIGVRIQTSWGPQNVAIEVDGPFHHASNRPDKPLGTTVLRDRMYAGQGFKVLALNYYELEKHRSGGKAAAAWLAKLLKEAGSTPPQAALSSLQKAKRRHAVELSKMLENSRS